MKNTVATFRKAKEEGKKLSMLTAYDYSTASLVDAAGIKVSVSKDGKKFESFGEENIAEVDKATEFGVKTHNIAAKKAKKVRYVNVVVESVKSLPQWHGFAGSQGFVFVDEISVK